MDNGHPLIAKSMAKVTDIQTPNLLANPLPDMRAHQSIQISRELIDDGQFDVVGHLAQKAAQSMARKIEEDLFASLGELTGSVVPTTTSGGVLTEEDFEKMLSTLGVDISGPMFGAEFMDKVVIMREFSETDNPFSIPDLEEITESARDQIFDVDWLCKKYDQYKLEESRNKFDDFIVKEAYVGNATLKSGIKEKVVYARGFAYKRDNVGVSNPTAATFSRGKRGIAGQAAQQMMVKESYGLGVMNSNGIAVAKSIDMADAWPAKVNIDAVRMNPSTQQLEVDLSAQLESPIQEISVEINLKGDQTE